VEIKVAKGLWANEAGVGPEEHLERWQKLMSAMAFNDLICWNLSHGLGD